MNYRKNSIEGTYKVVAGATDGLGTARSSTNEQWGTVH